jgi:hypothetical protein
MKGNVMSKRIFLLAFLLIVSAATASPVPGYLVTGEKPSKFEVRAESELQIFWQKI